MELTAAIEGLSAVPLGSSVSIFPNSDYVIRGITEWVDGWEARGWKTSAGTDVLNQDLWRRLIVLTSQRSVEWKTDRNYAGVLLNDMASKLAVMAIPSDNAVSLLPQPPRPIPEQQFHDEDTVYIYTDGACSENPGPGGWGAVIEDRKGSREINGSEDNTTNNRMELTAAIEAISRVDKSRSIILTTDSQYLKNGVETWLRNWERNNWQTSNKKEVKNQDLWMKISELQKTRKIQWRWVKGHSGHPQNERADKLAVEGVKNAKSKCGPTSVPCQWTVHMV
jgi:ribonuclease HI